MAITKRKDSRDAVELKADGFVDFISEAFHFVHFYTPWCGHCYMMNSAWQQLAAAFGGRTDVFISQMDCAKSRKLCAMYGALSYPSLIFFHDGEEVEPYRGARNLEDLKSYIDSKLYEHHVLKVDLEENIVQLTDDNFLHIISSGLVFVMFSVEGSPNCTELMPVWKRLGESNTDKAIKIAWVNCTLHQYICEGIDNYPLMQVFQNSIHLHDYHGEVTLPDLQNYADRFLHHDLPVHTEL